MTDERLDQHMNYERAKIFLNENLKVHITLKRLIPNTNRNVYHNGFLERVEENYLVINDLKEGPIRIFYFDIEKQIEEFKEFKNE